jgi:hypothetical protein
MSEKPAKVYHVTLEWDGGDLGTDAVWHRERHWAFPDYIPAEAIRRLERR